MAPRGLPRANRLALLVPAAALAAAYGFELIGHLVPCEMCWWQRYAHFAALTLALFGFVAPPRAVWVALAGLAIAASGGIGGYHAGVEYGWWQGVTECTSLVHFHAGQNALDAIMAQPVVRCDAVQWSLLGISMAGYNCLYSLVGAAAVFAALLRGAKS